MNSLGTTADATIQPKYKFGQMVKGPKGQLEIAKIERVSGSGLFMYNGFLLENEIEESGTGQTTQASASKRWIYVFENLRTGEIGMCTQQRQPNQFSKRAPDLEERVNKVLFQ